MANHEAWRLAGEGRGKISHDLEPVTCIRVSESEYICSAGVPRENKHAAYHIVIKIVDTSGGLQVVDSIMRQWAQE